ncbi:hypothetical protein Leryth_020820, partial [Lithospermum erythrorhizon]
SDYDDDEDDWETIDATVLKWIYTTISNDLLQRIIEPGLKAMDAWNRLQAIFQDSEVSLGIDIGDILSDKLEKLKGEQQAESLIFRVHETLRQVRQADYEPKIVSIGPYHHGKTSLEMIEKQKLRYLHSIIDRQEIELSGLAYVIKDAEQGVRSFYAESLESFSSDKLIEMLILDGCFIVQLVRKFDMPYLVEPNDPIFKFPWIMNSVQRDLLLLENQIPYFILQKLFGLIEKPNEERLVYLLLNFFGSLLPERSVKWNSSHYSDKSKNSEDHSGEHKISLDPSHKPNQLVDFIHGYWLPLGSNKSYADDVDSNKWDRRMNLLDLAGGEYPNRIPGVTELRYAGVSIIAKRKGKSLFDISFKNRTLKIPPFFVDDRTESVLMNLVAYEQFCDTNGPKFVTDYVTFLVCLINSSEDVQILRQHGIIDNLLGDNQVVADVFNRIPSLVIQRSRDEFRYAEVFKKINNYCNLPMRQFLVNFWRFYFNGYNRLAIIYLVAFTVLALVVAKIIK